MTDLKRVVREFKKVGAYCRKLRKKEAYICELENAEALIDKDKIVIRTLNEIDTDYLSGKTNDGVEDEELFKMLEEELGCEISIFASGDLRIEFIFPTERYKEVAKIFKRIATKDLSIEYTNLYGTLYLWMTKNGKREVVSTDEFIDAFLKD